MGQPAMQAAMERCYNIELLEPFATYLAHQRGLKPATVAGQVTLARQFLALAEHNPAALLLTHPFDLTTVDERALEVYLTHLSTNRGLAPNTTAAHLAVLRNLFSWLQREGQISRNPARLLKIPQWQKTPVLPKGEVSVVTRMFSRPGHTLRGSRLLLLLELIYGGGVQPTICYETTVLVADEERMELRLYTTEQCRSLPLSAAGLARVRHYLALRAQTLAKAHGKAASAEALAKGDPEQVLQDVDSGPFWVNEAGRAMSPGALARQVHRAMRQAGLQGGAEALRQLAARHFREQGADIRSAQEFLGARGLGQLDRYPALDFSEMVAAFRKAHPRQC